LRTSMYNNLLLDLEPSPIATGVVEGSSTLLSTRARSVAHP
jgi:hypothetical protein